MPHLKPLLLVRGGGDLASGVIVRLHRVGLNVIVTELPQPLAVRRTVSFAEAVYEGSQTVEGVIARFAEWSRIPAVLDAGEIPIIIDPAAEVLTKFSFLVVVDARLTKQPPAPLPVQVPLHIGLGPGFHAGEDCDVVIETRRSHTLGRVYWQGPAQPDSGQPEGDSRRVLRAPSEGILTGRVRIGEHVEAGEEVAVIGGQHSVTSPLRGVLRGLLRDGVHVAKDLKIGDVDPRGDPSACFLVSDKALAIGGGVLEAILTRVDIRKELWAPSVPSSETPPPNPHK